MKKNSFSINKNKKNKKSSSINKSYNNNSSTDQKNEILIIDLLKCPICKHICLMSINRDKLLFSFECNHNHNNLLKRSKTYINANQNYLKSNISDINFLPEKPNLKMINKDNNTLNQTDNFDCKKFNDSQKNYITENDFSCSKHNLKYKSYCYDCKENICEECNKEHFTHNKLILKNFKPKENEVISCKNEVIQKEKELNNIIEKMMEWKKEFEIGLNTIIKIMQNISNLRQFIIMNYDTRQSNQNFNYIQNFKNMKNLDFIFPELQEFFKEKNWNKRGHILIENIINIQNKIIENKENIKKEEINDGSQILKEKKEIEENNVLINQKNDINFEPILDMEKVSTTVLNKKRNYNTTFSSDCMNNNYFCRKFSNKTENNINNTKKKIIEKRNIDDIYLLNTIEKNKKLEEKISYVDIDDKIDENNFQEIKLDPKLIKDIELKNIYLSNLINNIKNIDEIQYSNNIGHLNNIDNNLEINNINNEENYQINNKKEKEIIGNNTNLKELNEIIINKKEHSTEDTKLNDKIKNNIENGVLRNKKNNKEKYFYKNIELKSELTNTYIIRSIEFTSNNHILISTLKNIIIYKLNPEHYELIKVYEIKEFNNSINYVSQLSNGDLIICSLNNINIIKLLDNNESLSYSLIQKIIGKNDSYNVNKVVEVKDKNLLISCDKNNLIKFSKNRETNLFEEVNYLSTNSEVKCIELINDNLFVSVEPEVQCIIFYRIDTMESNSVINNIQSTFGRYVISYIPQKNCIFVTGNQGIYLISTDSLKLTCFFKVGEWISSINYDYYNKYLICGTWKKNTVNEQKIYNLILYKINVENLDSKNKSLDNINIKEVERKNNVHYHDIVVIKSSEEGFILTGSNDRTVKLWK